MTAHRIRWPSATVEVHADDPRPRFTLRVRLDGPTSGEWRAAFAASANIRTSLGEPWGKVEADDDELLVHDLRPEQEENFLALLHGRLTAAVVHADGRTPLREERMTRKNYDAALRAGADRQRGAHHRARELTDRFRAQS